MTTTSTSTSPGPAPPPRRPHLAEPRRLPLHPGHPRGPQRLLPRTRRHRPDPRRQKPCAQCPVRHTCLDAALECGDTNGIRGGLTEEERKPLHETAPSSPRLLPRQRHPRRTRHPPHQGRTPRGRPRRLPPRHHRTAPRLAPEDQPRSTHRSSTARPAGPCATATWSRPSRRPRPTASARPRRLRDGGMSTAATTSRRPGHRLGPRRRDRPRRRRMRPVLRRPAADGRRHPRPAGPSPTSSPWSSTGSSPTASAPCSSCAPHPCAPGSTSGRCSAPPPTASIWANALHAVRLNDEPARPRPAARRPRGRRPVHHRPARPGRSRPPLHPHRPGPGQRH